jgi:hypothetical protein
MFSSTWLFLLPNVDTNARFPVLTAANIGHPSQPAIRRTQGDIERIAKVFGKFVFSPLQQGTHEHIYRSRQKPGFFSSNSRVGETDSFKAEGC